MLAAAGGEGSPAALAVVWALGAVVAMPAIVAVAGPVWLTLHRHGRRGPGVAAATAGSLILVVMTALQMSADASGRHALMTSVPAAIVAAAIGAVMQRIAYRRLL